MSVSDVLRTDLALLHPPSVYDFRTSIASYLSANHYNAQIINIAPSRHQYRSLAPVERGSQRPASGPVLLDMPRQRADSSGTSRQNASDADRDLIHDAVRHMAGGIVS